MLDIFAAEVVVENFLQYRSALFCKILLGWDRLGAAIEVQEEDVDNVKLAEEPSVTLGPVHHVWMSLEERLPGDVALLGLRVNGDHAPGEDEVTTPGVLVIKPLVTALAALGSDAFKDMLSYFSG